MCSVAMRSLLHTTNGNNPPAAGRKQQHCSSRCFVVSLLLVLVALVASDVYLSFPNRRNLLPLFPQPLLSRRSSRQRGGGGEGGGCDIFRGEWVPDPDAPYYTNHTCKVIHEHYDCMRYGKPDLGFVNWRWRPDGCDLPRFNPWRFLHMMRGKSLAFVGDSLGRNQKDSLICLLTTAAEPTTTSWPSSKHTVYYYGEYNFTVSHFWAPYLVRHEQIDEDGPAHTGVWNLYLDEPDDVWAAHVAELDYVVVSASSWFYRPSMLYEAGRLVGCHYCKLPNVTDLTPRYALRMATRAALRALSGSGADGSGRFRGTALLRTVDPSQYEGGEWNGDGNCVRTAPYRRGQKKVEGFERDFRTLQVEELASAAKAATDNGSKVRLLLMDTTEAMILRADAHPSKYRGWTPEKHFTLHNDCVHWCLPGAIDTWNDMLLHMLK